MSARLTIITVCRNVLPALERTVETVLSQGLPGLEYWIVDGASSDGTVEYLRRLETRGVRFVSEPDAGIADAMNKGVRLATGEWVAHLHADDEYLPGALAAALEHARAEADVDVLCGWLLKREPGGEAVYRADPARLPAEMTVNHPATLVRRAMFERHGGFDSAYPNAMDYEFFLRLFRRGARFRVIERPLARMAFGGQSERSVWRTVRETRDIRRLHGVHGWHASQAFALLIASRTTLRLGLQRLGLGALVGVYRRRFSWMRKG